MLLLLRSCCRWPDSKLIAPVLDLVVLIDDDPGNAAFSLDCLVGGGGDEEENAVERLELIVVGSVLQNTRQVGYNNNAPEEVEAALVEGGWAEAVEDVEVDDDDVVEVVENLVWGISLI